MTDRFSMSQVLKDLQKGPKVSPPPNVQQIVATAARHPKQYTTILSKLFYTMVDEQFRRPNSNVVSRYYDFSRGWHAQLTDEASKFYLASLDAYSTAVAAGFRELDWKAANQAKVVADALIRGMPQLELTEGIAWRCLLGQVQSLYSRGTAAETFNDVRTHEDSSLAAVFTRNIGIFSYFSENKVRYDRHKLPTLGQLQTWTSGSDVGSEQAFIVSMDPHFFRIYAPMILFNAQQLPKVDFVLLINASAVETQKLHMEAHEYLRTLSILNKQAMPRNLRFLAIEPPTWVANKRTFYACSRFIVLPELLEQYTNVYAIDADLFMLRNPELFLRKVASLPFGITRTEGLHGVPPWRRYMAGNIVANRKAIDSNILRNVLDYLSVGLGEPNSWTLDQNALCYGAESEPHGYEPMTTARPMVVGNFMAQWERNYKNSISSFHQS